MTSSFRAGAGSRSLSGQRMSPFFHSSHFPVDIFFEIRVYDFLPAYQKEKFPMKQRRVKQFIK